ncbi:hypothetical protein Tco_0174340 [Tanacetum coccineum]
MSSPTYPTLSDVNEECTFPSTNILGYTSTLPNYFPATSGNISSDFSENSKNDEILLVFSPFFNNPYLKDVQAFYAKESPIPPQDPISPPAILTQSTVLTPSLLFYPRYLFVPEELLPPKKQIHPPSSSSTTLSNSSRKQAYTLVPPSFSTYTPTPPQIYELGKSSIKMHVEHHEKQIESILNYLEELSFHYIEKIEERLVNDWIIIPRDFDEVKTKLKEARTQILELQKKHMGQRDNIAFMPPKRTSTSEASAMTHASIRKLVAGSVDIALEAQAATMASTNNPNRNSRPRRTPTARKCTYEKFMSCQPFYFNGTEGVVGLIRCFERIKSVFSLRNYTEKNKVKFAINTLTEEALFWWNSFAQPVG